MQLSQKVLMAAKLGNYLLQNNDEWQQIKHQAYRENPWFIPEFIDTATKNIAEAYLNESLLEKWLSRYPALNHSKTQKTVGVVMAGNLPLVGFHDFLSVFLSGHKQQIKLSSKDQVLLKHLLAKMTEWDPAFASEVSVVERLKDCDAYIATGSNNSSRYFDYYFGNKPHIIRKNRTSVAVLTGVESKQELNGLASDLMLYFGLGCRNVTKLYVPEGYDFVPLIEALKVYNYYLDFHKYHHNFDYQLAILMMNSKLYMNSGSLLFLENEALFSPISLVHYSFYNDLAAINDSLKGNEDIQCIIGKDNIPFGQGQRPTLTDYADNVDTMEFLAGL